MVRPDRSVIRLAEPRDGAALAAIYRPAIVDSAISFEFEPPDGATMTSRAAATLVHLPWLVCDIGADIVGYAYATRYRERPAYQWSVEVSAYVRQDMRRAGVARALYASLFAILVLQGFRNAYAGITLPNDASVGLHRAVGFTPIGVYRGAGHKLGAWHDVAWFERPLAPRDSDPEPPQPLPQILNEPAFADALAAGLMHLRPPIG